MAINVEVAVTEIHEDAYKQNSVYRPWKDIRAGSLNIAPSLKPARTKKAVVVTRDLDQLSAAALR